MKQIITTLHFIFEILHCISNTTMKFYTTIFTYLSLVIMVAACAEDDGFSSFTKSENFKILGSSAQDLLTSERYSNLTIEFVYNEGHPPSPFTITTFKSFLEQRLYKSSITIKLRSIPDVKEDRLSLEDMIKVEREHRTTFTTTNDISVFVYFANASYVEDTSNQITLGTAYLNTSVIVFEKSLQKVAASMPNVAFQVIESAALQHEFLHLLGLVNDISAGNALDISGVPNHCDNKNCLMAANILFTTDTTATRLTDQLPTLDSTCLSQLRNMGGK